MVDISPWQPFSTAPQDGTQIIVPIGHGFFDVVSWFDGGWREGGNAMRLIKTPACWMPIPAEPAEKPEPLSTDEDAEF